MALTYTPPGELGSTCPDFQLNSADGKPFALKDFADKRALVVMFICNHCPYVQAVEDRLLSLARALPDAGFVAICSNDPTDHPEDAPAELARRAREKNYPFPYLVDEAQDVARAFGAVCTPDLYLYDQNRKLVYRGRLDDSWRDPSRVTRQELKAAIEAVLAGQPVNEVQNPSMGCSIKWKSGDVGSGV